MFNDTLTDNTVDNPKAEKDADREREPEPESDQPPKTFDWNDPALADEEADQINPDQDADEFPPPPPDAIYTVDWDFNEPDEEKRWSIRDHEKKGTYLLTSISGKIVDCDDPKIADRRWVNRKLRAPIMTMTNSDGTSSMTDFEKSIGLKKEVIRISRMNKKTEQRQAHRDVLTKALTEGVDEGSARGKVAVQWQASYKRAAVDAGGEPITDDNGNPTYEYIRPGGKLANGQKIDKNHPINTYRGMRYFPIKTKWDEDLEKEVPVLDDAGQPLRNPIVKFVDPDTGEEVEARASAEVRTFMPKR